MARQRRRQRVEDRDAQPGPLRLCAVTRVALPKDHLIRFVAAPDGTIVADPKANLPGRGVWVCAERAVVAEAARSRAFARSLKDNVKVAPDLDQQVENLLEHRALDALSMANKAGRVTAGFEKISSKIEGGSVAALLHARDGAEGGTEKLDRKLKAVAAAAGRGVMIFRLFTITQMSLAMGRSNVVHAALERGGATDRFLIEAGRLMRYRPAGLDDTVEDGSCDDPDPAEPGNSNGKT